MQKTCRIVCIVVLVFLPIFVAAPVSGAGIDPPENGHFILDLAGLLEPEDARHIQDQANLLLAEYAIPLVVLTVDSMAEHGGARMSVETFARRQFEAWGNHPHFPHSEHWRRGILLLVAVDDRKARIELGAEWALEFDPQCERIMYAMLVPAFKQGFYSAGIADGTDALARMSRGEVVDVSPFKSIEYKLRSAFVDWEYKVATFVFIALILTLSRWLDSGRVPSRYFGGASNHQSTSRNFGGGGGASGSW